MKRLGPRYKLIFNHPALLVGDQDPMFKIDLFSQRLKPRFHQIGRGFRIAVVKRKLNQFSVQKSTFNGVRSGAGQICLFRFNGQNPHRGLISGQGNRYIQSMLGCPENQFFGGVSPTQPEGRLQNGLCGCTSQGPGEEQYHIDPFANVPGHARTVKSRRLFRKQGTLRRGFVLVEAMMSLSLLTFIGIILLKLSLSILHPRQWILQQTVTDAYMSYERAYAERIPFEDLLSDDSPWPAFPEKLSSTVEVGRLPGASTITGTVTRTRIADPSNYVVDGGTGTEETNPAAMKVWKAQSVLTYQIGNRTYARSRTVLRSQ